MPLYSEWWSLPQDEKLLGGISPEGLFEDSLSSEPIPEVEEPAKPESVQRKQFMCTVEGCAKSYSTPNHLKVHLRNHTGIKPFHCRHENCGKSFATNYSLKAHTRVHTGDRPYKCKVCGKSFKTSGDMQKHLRIHTGVRPFVCEICQKAFTTSNILKVHKRTHTGERPYGCEVCKKTFASHTNLKNHRRIHSGEKPYVCEAEGCGRRFTEYSSLFKHQLVHVPHKPFPCTFCDKGYRLESTLTLHHRTAHNYGPEEAEAARQALRAESEPLDMRCSKTKELHQLGPVATTIVLDGSSRILQMYENTDILNHSTRTTDNEVIFLPN